MKEKIYETELGNIKYYITGEFDHEKDTLVLLPGLTADHRLFDKQIEYFKDKYNILVWDAPGHYESYPFELKFTLFDKAKWLDEILEKENVKNPILIGQSMGGYIGQVYLEIYKDRLKGFVSIDSAPLKKKYMSKFELWSLKHTESMYKMYSWNLLKKEGAKGCSETEYGYNLMYKMMDEYDKNRYVKLVSNGYLMLAEAIERDLKYDIPCPCILLCGEKDKAGFTKRYNKEWSKNENLKLHLIPNAGHNSNTDNPILVNKIIEEFITSI